MKQVPYARLLGMKVVIFSKGKEKLISYNYFVAYLFTSYLLYDCRAEPVFHQAFILSLRVGHHNDDSSAICEARPEAHALVVGNVSLKKVQA